MRRNRLLTVVATAVLAVGALTACGRAAGGGDPDTVTIQGDAGNPTLLENFNPFVSTQLGGSRVIYETLEVISAVDGTARPFLATGHRFVSSTKVEVPIRSGVTWSDGKPMTADDVLFTFQLVKKFPALDLNGVWTQIKSISVSGSTVTFTLKTANVPFYDIIAKQPIVPRHLWQSVKDPVKYTNTHPVGTGPYKLDTFAPTQYRLVRNEKYWNVKAVAAKYAVFPAQSADSNVGQLSVVNGDFDWAYSFLPKVDKTYLKRDRSNRSYWFPPGGTISLFLNLTKKPYSNQSFRQGISLALNRTTIAQKAVNGYLTQASATGLVLPNLEKFLDPSLPNKGFVSQDIDGALAKFKQAGYTLKGNRLVDSSGKQMSMTVLVPAGFNDWIQGSAEVKQQLAKVGIAVTVDTPQYTQYSQQAFTGNFEAAFGGWGGTGNPYNDYNNVLNSSFAAKVGTSTVNNFQRFKDTSVDNALDQLAAAVGEDAQKQAAYKIEQAVYTQVPLVPLYYGGSWGLFNSRNFTDWPSAKNPYNLPTNYTNALLDVLTRIKKS